MPIQYQLKPVERLVIIAHVGVVTDDEFLAFYKALYNGNKLDRSFNVLVDLRHTDSTVRSKEAIYEFTRLLRKDHPRADVSPKTAVVAESDISFGMARMYEFFSEDVPWEVEVFRSIKDALVWISSSASTT